jgi:hypothetical protein
MTAAQKQLAKFRESNLEAAHRILSDPHYIPGSLMRRWAEMYLQKHGTPEVTTKVSPSQRRQA